MWGRIVDPQYHTTQAMRIAEAGRANRALDADDRALYNDMFLKHISQAFAEQASGDVYLVVRDSVAPDNQSWNTDRAWGGETEPFPSGGVSGPRRANASSRMGVSGLDEEPQRPADLAQRPSLEYRSKHIHTSLHSRHAVHSDEMVAVVSVIPEMVQ